MVLDKNTKKGSRDLAPQGVLQSLSKCQQSKVDKISDRYGMSNFFEVHWKKKLGLEKLCSRNFQKSQNFKWKMWKEIFRWNFKFSKFREKQKCRDQFFFSGVEENFDIPYRSEILSTFDFWHFGSDRNTSVALET